MSFEIGWGARSPGRATATAPSSALSAVVTLTSTTAGATPVTMTVNRADGTTSPAAYASSYVFPSPLATGAYTLSVTFYAQSAGAGAVVGTAGAPENLVSPTDDLGPIQTVDTIVAVSVAPNQTIPVGQQASLSFTPRDLNGNVVAVEPGSDFWAVAAGSSPDLQFIGSRTASALLPGSVPVTVTVDGVTSAATPVAVTSNATVSVTPTSANIPVSTQQTFVAAVANAPAGSGSVTWSVQEAGGGSITSAGVYVAPGLAGVYHVVATSAYDPSKSASAAVTVAPTIGASPTPATVILGGSQTFTATIAGLSNTEVAWSVVEATGGTITANGTYTAPYTPGTYHVVATSVAQATLTATVTVTVPAGAISITPSAPTATLGDTINFTDTVTGVANTGVTWTITEGATGGAITSTGTYTAPNQPGTYHVVVTSTVVPTMSATAIVTIQSGGGNFNIN